MLFLETSSLYYIDGEYIMLLAIQRYDFEAPLLHYSHMLAMWLIFQVIISSSRERRDWLSTEERRWERNINTDIM